MTPVEETSTEQSIPLTHRAVLAMSVPIILSNITTPLVGAVDTAVVGQLGDAALLGGVAIGAVLFQLLFWSFGFLRMGTSGLTAQAFGAGDTSEIAATLERALLVAVALGLGLIVLQRPIGLLTLPLVGGSAEVQAAARTYYDWRIWAAPFVFVNYALLGWFIGLGEAGRAFALQLLLDLVNIGVSIWLVLGLKWGVAGAGAAALAAEAVASAAGLALAFAELSARGGTGQPRRHSGVRKTQTVVRRQPRHHDKDALPPDRFCQLHLPWRPHWRCGAGGQRRAVRPIRHRGLFLDGFANAAEVFVGQAIGARQRPRIFDAIWMTSLWAGALSLFAALLLWRWGGAAIDLMTTSPDVRAAARTYLPWCALTPLAGFAAFQLDGIFIGATRGPDMRNMMLISLAVFLGLAAILMPAYGNHGLWLALILFFLVRAITLGSRLPALVRDALG